MHSSFRSSKTYNQTGFIGLGAEFIQQRGPARSHRCHTRCACGQYLSADGGTGSMQKAVGLRVSFGVTKDRMVSSAKR